MNTARTILGQLFGDYRAEWQQPYFASLFVPPPYLPRLETNRPCLLIGGRGTGKTTALKSLRFDASELRVRTGETAFAALPYFGVYIRVNKNQVRAFDAPEISAADRSRAFAHYFNILACKELCQLALWLERQMPESQGRLPVEPVGAAFDLSGVVDVRRLSHELDRQLTSLELWVNNGGALKAPVFSIAEKPIRAFADCLNSAGFLEGKLLFCCIDEYENLSELQQTVLNTYIKHSQPPISYKIGMRRDGFKSRRTIDSSDLLQTPADFAEIDISEEGFDAFAERVVEQRLQRARADGVNVPTRVSDFMPAMPFDEEAERLGCSRVATQIRQSLANSDEAVVRWANAKPDAKLYLLGFWAESSGGTFLELALDWMRNEELWDVRHRNYGYASLFWLSKGRKGARIRKYYSGAGTLLSMASGNIRYFLELIDGAVNIHFEDGNAASDQREISISPSAQTEAARTVGKRRLDQLEGLSERGIELKRLVLAVGKVFFELARDPAGRAPEQNSFILSGSLEAQAQIRGLLNEGVSHLAFEVTPKTKATSQSELRDDEYRLHPIFCAFFEFSHRRKRRVSLSADSLLKLSTAPSAAITELLGSRQQTEQNQLPEQLAFFTDFYGRTQ